MKRLLIGLGVAIAMTFAGNAWAQVPPDVPPGHWAYDAIEELMRDGIIKGYPDGTFKGKAPLTRYEFAIAIRDALAAIRQQIDEVRAQIPQQPTQPSQPTTAAASARYHRRRSARNCRASRQTLPSGCSGWRRQ
jgi:DNA-directed RNA polymerase specialized sigma24 family protein